MLKLIILILLIPAWLTSTEIFLDEGFDDLGNWEELNFPKIENRSTYSVDSGKLVATSNNSASGIILKESFDVYKYPIVSWNWMIENVYNNGDATRKDGDDYPIRIYIIFEYDHSSASLGKKIKYNAAKAIYKEYPPDSSLNYIWANRPQAQIITSPYTKQSKMWVLKDSSDSTNKWFSEEINIVEDYQKAFGTMPPKRASIAIMNDSDNTEESSKSYLDFIIIKSEK